MADARAYNVTLRPLYKCIRAELVELGARGYWHLGMVPNAPLCATFRPVAFACVGVVV